MVMMMEERKKWEIGERANARTVLEPTREAEIFPLRILYITHSI